MVQKQHKGSKEILEERQIHGFDFSVYMTAPTEGDSVYNGISAGANDSESKLVENDVDDMKAFGGVKDEQ